MKKESVYKSCSFWYEIYLKEIGNISKESLVSLNDFIKLTEDLKKVASKETHYHNLDIWMKPVYEFVNNELSRVGFRNVEIEYNDSYPDIRFWWSIYRLLSSITYSPNLKSITEIHHSSAYERNDALNKDLKYILSQYLGEQQ